MLQSPDLMGGGVGGEAEGGQGEQETEAEVPFMTGFQMKIEDLDEYEST
jgi:hypothetical protein